MLSEWWRRREERCCERAQKRIGNPSSPRKPLWLPANPGTSPDPPQLHPNCRLHPNTGWPLSRSFSPSSAPGHASSEGATGSQELKSSSPLPRPLQHQRQDVVAGHQIAVPVGHLHVTCHHALWAGPCGRACDLSPSVALPLLRTCVQPDQIAAYLAQV